MLFFRAWFLRGKIDKQIISLANYFLAGHMKQPNVWPRSCPTVLSLIELSSTIKSTSCNIFRFWHFSEISFLTFPMIESIFDLVLLSFPPILKGDCDFVLEIDLSREYCLERNMVVCKQRICNELKWGFDLVANLLNQPFKGLFINYVVSKLCVQMDFTRTFEANAKCNNINHV